MPMARGSWRAISRTSRASVVRGHGHWPSAARLFSSIATIVAGVDIDLPRRERLVGIDAFGPQAAKPGRRERDDRAFGQQHQRAPQSDPAQRIQRGTRAVRGTHKSISIPS